MGYEDYFYSNAYCFIEWPEKIAELLPADHVRVDITVKEDIRSIDGYLPVTNNEWLPIYKSVSIVVS